MLDGNFKVQEISEILNVSKRTIEQQMSNYELTAANRFTDITDEKLDNAVRAVTTTSPDCGSKLLTGYLWARGL